MPALSKHPCARPAQEPSMDPARWSGGCPPALAGAATPLSARGAASAKAHEQNKSHRQPLNAISCSAALAPGANPKIRWQLGTSTFRCPKALRCLGRRVCHVLPATSLGSEGQEQELMTLHIRQVHKCLVRVGRSLMKSQCLGKINTCPENNSSGS